MRPSFLLKSFLPTRPHPANTNYPNSKFHPKKMFKSKLQEYCHSKAWLLPDYSVTRQGHDHCPHFQAVVNVNGFSFSSPDSCNTSKEAQNLAAKLAFECLTLSGCSSTGIPTTGSPASNSAQLPEMQQTSPIASCDGANRVTNDSNMFKDGTHMYKNQLQSYAQKRNLELPIYSVERVGPSHASQFKCKVKLEDKTYGSEDYFYTIKEAESTAAKVALASIFPGGFEEDDPSIYKNLLQELLQKEVSCLPKYTTTLAGPSHMPVFVSVVEIQGETFSGQEAKTKKQAEMNAAKVAYIALRERRCKQDESVSALAARLEETLQVLPAIAPEGGSDAQLMFDKQAECNQENVTAPTPNSFKVMPEVSTNTSSKRIENLKATHSNPDPVSCSINPSSSTSSKPVEGLHDLEKGKKKKKQQQKKKIMVFPQSSTKSHPDAPVMHSDEKWIAFATDSC